MVESLLKTSQSPIIFSPKFLLTAHILSLQDVVFRSMFFLKHTRNSVFKISLLNRLPYTTIFGGAGAFKKEDFEMINGFSNHFWGWGGEDDDLYRRYNLRNEEQQTHFTRMQ